MCSLYPGKLLQDMMSGELTINKGRRIVRGMVSIKVVMKLMVEGDSICVNINNKDVLVLCSMSIREFRTK